MSEQRETAADKQEVDEAAHRLIRGQYRVVVRPLSGGSDAELQAKDRYIVAKAYLDLTATVAKLQAECEQRRADFIAKEPQWERQVSDERQRATDRRLQARWIA